MDQTVCCGAKANCYAKIKNPEIRKNPKTETIFDLAHLFLQTVQML